MYIHRCKLTLHPCEVSQRSLISNSKDCSAVQDQLVQVQRIQAANSAFAALLKDARRN